MKTKREILLEYAKNASCGKVECSQCQYNRDETCTSNSLIRDKLIRIGAMAILRMFPKGREFDPSRVLTCVTANKAEIGMEGYFADNLVVLKERFYRKDINTKILSKIRDEIYSARFVDEACCHYNLFYPIEEVEE